MTAGHAIVCSIAVSHTSGDRQGWQRGHEGPNTSIPAKSSPGELLRIRALILEADVRVKLCQRYLRRAKHLAAQYPDVKGTPVVPPLRPLLRRRTEPYRSQWRNLVLPRYITNYQTTSVLS